MVTLVGALMKAVRVHVYAYLPLEVSISEVGLSFSNWGSGGSAGIVEKRETSAGGDTPSSSSHSSHRGHVQTPIEPAASYMMYATGRLGWKLIRRTLSGMSTLPTTSPV